MFNYQDFTLIINGSPGAYTIEARGPGEVSAAPQPLDAQDTARLESERQAIQQGEPTTRQRMQELGTLLYNALFPRPVARLYANSTSALPAGAQMRLKLVIRPPELNALPWELIYDPEAENFLGAQVTYPIVRFIESLTPVAKMSAPKPLRVLYIQAAPQGMAALDLEASLEALRQGFGDQAEVTVLRSVTPAALSEALRQPYHILHYDGHAVFDEQSQQGYAILQDDSGKVHLLSGEMLGTYLKGTPVRLVVLAACGTGTDSVSRRFSGIAQQLMKNSSLPAVVAMQFRVPDASAVAFSAGFYAALADRYPVDSAVIEGRKAILGRQSGDPFQAPDWVTPVLFMRAPDGKLFEDAILSATPQAENQLRRDQASEGFSALGELIQNNPKALEAVTSFRTVFQGASSQVKVLADYKGLHDLLHSLQFDCGNLMTKEIERLPDDEEAIDNLMDPLVDLEDILEQLNKISARTTIPKVDYAWIDEVVGVHTEFKKGLDDRDAKALGHSLWRLNRVLTTYPSRINKSLSDATRALKLPALVEALSEIIKTLEGLKVNEDQLIQIRQGSKALSDLANSLQALVDNHDHWQELDNELRRVDGMLKVDFTELENSWPDLKEKSDALVNAIPADWAVALHNEGASLDECLISQNPARTKVFFKNFRKRVSNRFFQVDIDLKNLCDQLVPLAEPLTALLGTK